MQMIQPANAAEWDQVRELFREYWTSFGFSPCFQDFGAEVAGLPGAYAPPGGALVPALADGEAPDAPRCAASTHSAPRPSASTYARGFAVVV
jgi:hypothetical protein